MSFAAGFSCGLEKAARMDNQPGPHPGNPEKPDSHKARNVALGAALLVGGSMAAKGLHSQYKATGAAATSAIKSQRAGMAKSIGQQAIAAKGDPGQMAKVKAVGAKFQQLNKQPIAPTMGQRFDALKQMHAPKVENLKNRLGLNAEGQRRRAHDAFMGGIRDKVDPDLVKKVFNDSPHLRKTLQQQHPDIVGAPGPSLGKRLKRTAVVGGVLGAGSLMGASAASNAQQPQNDEQLGAR
jgi:hypothetical protein